MHDLRLAFRQLLKSPGFTAVAALTIALGFGAITTFFSVLYGVVLKPLPLPRAHELVEIKNVGPALGQNVGRVSPAELRDYRARSHSFVGIGSHAVGRVTLDRPDGAERIVYASVTANLFPLLGVTPILGRGFEEAEERPGQNVVVLSHAFWQSEFAGAPDVIGRSVRFNGVSHTVVGVMPADFAFEDSSIALWQPLDFSSHGEADRRDHFLPAIARLAPGVSLRSALADLRRVADELRRDLPAAYPAEPEWKLNAVTLRESRFGEFRDRLSALVAAASAVLLIACVNVTIMFLLRAAMQRRELMIRLSLGAGRRHIVGQLLAESVIVCVFGAIVGAFIAVGGLKILQAFPPADIPRLAEVSLNLPVAAFCAAVLLLVTLFVGLAPALVVLRMRANLNLSHAARTTDSRGAVRLREGLTVAEIALAVLLLVGGGLAAQSLRNLLRDDVGFSTAQLFTFKTNLTAQAYSDLGAVNRFYDRFAAKLAELPGVTAVAGVSYLPLSGESQFQSVQPLGQPAKVDSTGRPPSVAWRVVRGPYFHTMDTRLLLGRFFNESDQAGAPLVAIVDDVFARRFWSDESAALGQSVRFGEGDNAQVRTIVGIVHRQKHNGPGQYSIPEAFVPLAQNYIRGMYTVLKLQGSPTGLATLVRSRLAEVDPTIPMYFVETMEQRYTGALALPRFTAGLVGAFAGLALVLAAVGIFGVTAYAVSQRTREFGIRFAIGAPRSHIVGLVLGRVGRLAAIGGAIGCFAAYQLAQLMTGLLVGVEPADLSALAMAAAAISVTALVASLVPLVRALRVDPIAALRAE